jgi:hypothetical protein
MVLENRGLRIFGLKREEVAGEWRRLHDEELHNLYASPNIIRAIKSRRMRLAGHVAQWERREMHTLFWVVNVKRRDHSENLVVDGRTILELILGKVCGMMWTGIHLAQEREQWRFLMNALINLRAPIKGRVFKGSLLSVQYIVNYLPQAVPRY